jgi:hypothetical protein
MNKLVVGQSLWFVGSSFSRFAKIRAEVTVSSVGKRWAHVTGPFIGRIDTQTLAADGQGCTPPGSCYLSHSHWLEKEGPDLAWRKLRAEMSNTCPAGVTYSTVVQAAQLLQVDAEVLGVKRDEVMPAGTDDRLAGAIAAAPAQQFRYAMHALRAIADGVIQPGRYAELAIRHIAGDASQPQATSLPGSPTVTPRSDQLEDLRKGMGQARTPAYGDALSLCRTLEAEVARLTAALAAQNESTPA